MRQDYFTGVRPFLERRYGNRDDLALAIIAPQVPVSESAAVRGRQLKEAIRLQLENMPPDTRVHILAHSMGGLDGRWVIAKGGLADRIDSLTTIATPHRGTSLGDVAYAARRVIPTVADGFYQVDHVVQQIEDKFHDSFKWLTGRKVLLAGDHLEALRHLLGNLVKHTTPAQLERGLHDLTLEGVRNFNDELAEAERAIRSGPGRSITYAAYGGDLSSQPASLLKPSYDLIRVFGTQKEKAEGNDGAVSAWSSHFPWDDAGREYVETLPFDHFGQINWRIPDVRPDDELGPALIPVYEGIMTRIVSSRS
jgi:hypothetical protein